MSNHHWVCFTCRTVTRRPSMSTDVRCRECGAGCESLGYKTPIPPRYKIKEWDTLFRYYHESTRVRLESIARYKRAWRQALVKRVATLKRRPPNKARAALIRSMQREIEGLWRAP